MKKTRLLAILIALAMLMAAFAGCSGSGKDPEQTTAAPSQTSGSSASQGGSDSSVSSEAQTTVPSMPDLKGYEFILAGYRNGCTWSEAPSNSLEDALVQYYYDVEQLLNCTITVNPEPDKATVITASTAGECVGDFIYGEQKAWGEPSVKGYLRPLDTEEVLAAGLNIFDPEVCNQDLIRVSEFMGQHFIVVFETRTMAMFSHGYVFNKDLIFTRASVSADQIYQMVRDFTWTWDEFIKICRDVSEDTNGDGVNDYDGVCRVRGQPELSSNGVRSVEFNEDTGRYYCGYGDPRYAKAADWFFNKVCSDSDVYMIEDRPNMHYFWDVFVSTGTAAFASCERNDFGVNGVNDRMESDYGFVPMPHGPDATSYSHIINSLGGFYMQYTNQNWATSCVVMNQLAMALNDPEGVHTLIMEYMRNDEQAVEMIEDYMMPSAKLLVSNMFKDMEGLDLEEAFIEMGLANALESLEPKLSAALDEYFGYNK